MKKLIPLLFFLCTGMLHAQVGINTTAPNAQLDIRSANQAAPTNQDGLLIPKVDTFPAINPTIDQNGMLVFLTTTVGTNLPGFYYWDHPTTRWKGIGNDNTKWGVNGNAGTNAATHFIGTTDNQNVIFKRNNVRAGTLSGIITSFGLASLNNATAYGSAAFGLMAGQFMGGTHSTAIGYQSMYQSLGDGNLGVGSVTLSALQAGNDNTAIGLDALSNITGSTANNNNVAAGANAGSSILVGSGNIMIGANADSTPSSTNKFVLVFLEPGTCCALYLLFRCTP